MAKRQKAKDTETEPVSEALAIEPEMDQSSSQHESFETPDVFALEKTFPTPSDLLKPHKTVSADDKNLLVVLDTNALLLPYEIKTGNLKALGDVFAALAKQDRIFVPDRVIREFARNRDRKLTALIDALETRRSKELPPAEMPPVLESVPGFEKAKQSRDELSKHRGEYAKAI